MHDPFQAVVIDRSDTSFTVNVKQASIKNLSEGNVLIRVHYSGVNYKDGLASTPNGKVVRSYPHIPGIDLAGVVVSSEDPRFKPGDEVIATSYEIGVSHSGGYSEYARIPSDWLVPLPAGLSLREAMIVGTAGFTAALSVQKLEGHGVKPDDGEILVTGATGGVGSFGVAMLAKLGYDVTASTGKQFSEHYLSELGANRVLTRTDVHNGEIKPLNKQRWAGAVDPVGGEMLASVLSQVKYGGAVAVSGLAGGTTVPTNVFPFILRGVSLLGIDSVYCPMETRRKVWERIASDLRPDSFEPFVAKEVTLSELPDTLPSILSGSVRGRIVVKVKE